MKIKIVGPFISNYSLAQVNRNLARAMSQSTSDEIKLHQSADKLDKIPTQEDLKKFDFIDSLWSREDYPADVVIYNDYPKTGHNPHGIKDLNADLKLVFIAWEETVYPKFWVDEINQHAHGILAASAFNKDIFIRNGINVPIEVVGEGIAIDMQKEPTEKYELKTQKKYKFLHISTGRKRKGIDVLIKAYFEAFTKNDDVCLVIKSFPSADNLVDEVISEFRTENSPEIEHIYNPDLTDQDIVNLIHTCDAGVYPTRTEGFGLTILESMWHGKPTIATNYSAHLDFCNSENSFLINYELQDTLESEQVNSGSKWAEPDVEELKETLKYLYASSLSETEFQNYKLQITNYKSQEEIRHDISSKVENSVRTARNFTWENTAKKVTNFIRKIKGIEEAKHKNLAVVSFYNNEDGVAEYTRDLYVPLKAEFKNFYIFSNSDISDRVNEDENFIIRNWESGEKDFVNVIQSIKDLEIDILHVQYHSGINFSIEALDLLIQKSKDLNIKVFVTIHALRDKSFDLVKESKNLKLADKILIHNKEDFDYYSAAFNNGKLFVHPKFIAKKRSKNNVRKALGLPQDALVIGTHGLINRNKNIPEIINAVGKLKNDHPNVIFFGLSALSANNISAQEEYEKCLKAIEANNLQDQSIMLTEFLSVEQIEFIMQAFDLNVLAYIEAGESASGAINKCFAAGRPTLVSDIKAFQEFKNEVYKVSAPDAESMSNGIKKLLTDQELQRKIVDNANNFIEENSYQNKGIEMVKCYFA
jgi:glycosyltransferase involved in cell wall biosynthesis